MRIPNPFVFAAALARLFWAFIRGQKMLVPPEVEEARLGECHECPFLDHEARQCTVCTCFIDLKCPVATEKCPKGRWARYWGRRH